MGHQDEKDSPAPGFPTGFAEAAFLDQLPRDGLLRVKVDDLDIAIADVDGNVVAVSDLCLRCNGSLASGTVSQAKLKCGRCGWKYDPTHGSLEGLPALRIETHEVRVVDGRIFVATSARWLAVS